MTFKMNNRTWSIKEAEQSEIINEMELKEHEIEKGTKYFGITDYTKQQIFLWKDLCIEQKRSTLKHELMHAYIGTYITFQEINFTEEMLCDISSNAHDLISDITTKYFEEEIL